MAPRRLDIVSNLLWPLVIIVAAVLWTMYTLGALPPVILDLIGRGWPVLLVALGLMLLLGRRLRLGNLLALGLSGLFVAGVMVLAYNRQAAQVREDYTEPVAQALGAEITSLQATLELRQTEIEILPTAPGERAIRGQFVGSLESLVTADFRAEGGVGILVLSERPRNAIPMLDQVGRGKLTLYLPADLAIEQLTINGMDGDLALELASLHVRRLAVTLGNGSIEATFADESGLIGDLKTGGGPVTVTIPPALAAQIALRGGGASAPRYSDEQYTLRIDNVLVPKRAADPQMQLTIETPGTIIVR